MTHDPRGQTLQDYVIGITIFIFAVTFVLTLFPGYLTGFTTGVGAQEDVTADRLATNIVTNYTAVGDANDLNASGLRETLEANQSQLRAWYGLPESATVNVTVRTLDGTRVINSTDPFEAGPPIDDRTVATNARIVTLDGQCDPACRLVVSVW